jgi:hypothetical protein
MTPSDYAAWYAAIVATVVLIWDVVKWKSGGPQVKAEAFGGWKSYGISETEGKALTLVKATNVGDRATTLTSWGMYWYPAGVSVKKKETRKAFIVKGGLAGLGQVPKKLEPGDVWSGVASEDDQYNEMLRTGQLFMVLGFSHTDEEVLVSVKKPANTAVERDSPQAAPPSP